MTSPADPLLEKLPPHCGELLDAVVKEGCFTTNADLVVCSWNAWMERHSGLSAATVVGQPLFRLFPSLVERRLDALYRQALAGEPAILAQRLHHYLLPFPLAGNKAVRSSREGLMEQYVRIAPVNQGGRVAGTVTLVEDVTDRVRYEQALRHEVAVQEALLEISRSVLSVNLDECLGRIVREAAAIVGAKVAGVFLQQDGKLRLAACTDPSQIGRVASAAAEEQSANLAPWIAQTGQTARLDDLLTAALETRPTPLDPATRSILGAPLRVGEEILGVLMAESPRVAAFSAGEERVLLALALNAAAAIHNARLFSALAESQARFSSAFEHAPIGMALVSLQGHWLKVNRALGALVGYSPEELAAKTFQDLVWPDDLVTARAAAERLLAGAVASCQTETRMMHKDGHTLWTLVNQSLVRGAHGRPLHVVAQVLDITQRKAAEAERDRTIAELQKALAEVRTLQGIIPICAGCKKIRDDKGYWSQVETYISKHSAAKFSHGLCPDCIKKYYPEEAVSSSSSAASAP